MTKWDERYQTEDYIFGTEPNEFIARIQSYLPTSGRALDLATGEGRNGVFLALHGLETEGVDMSKVGLLKAQALARKQNVSFTTRLANIAEMDMPTAYYAVITSVFCHFMEPQRTQVMQRIVGYLPACFIIRTKFIMALVDPVRLKCWVHWHRCSRR